jgi:hypothetical protein
MERLSLVAAMLAWELRRLARAFMRHGGRLGIVLLLAAVLGVAAVVVGRQQGAAAQQAKVQLAERLAQRAAAPPPPPVSGERDGRARLKAFDDYLPPHDDIPTVVQDLLNQAEDLRLVLARGDYRAQPDLQGGFMRYRMSLPVKGDAPTVLKLMQSALQSHKTLALESVQFKRARVESTDVEVRLQWVLLTRLPEPVR